MTSGPRQLALAAICVLVVLTSCSLRRADGTKERPEREFGGGIAEPEKDSNPQSPPAASETEEPAHGTLALTVLDQNKKPPPEGITIMVQGRESRTLTTDGKAVISLTLQPGTYKFSVKTGCTNRMQVASGGSGNFSIVGGESTKGSTDVTWRHRYRPWMPTFADRAPNWDEGETIEITYYVIDRCDEEDRVANAEYPTFVFRPSPNLKLTGDPVLKSDAEGLGKVHVACTNKGRPALVASDSKNPSDEQIDLLQQQISSPQAFNCR